MSAWARCILVGTAQPDPLHFLLLAELLTLRTIVLNLNFALAKNGILTEEAMHGLIDRADTNKFDKANERIDGLRHAVEATRRPGQVTSPDLDKPCQLEPPP